MTSHHGPNGSIRQVGEVQAGVLPIDTSRRWLTDLTSDAAARELAL